MTSPNAPPSRTASRHCALPEAGKRRARQHDADRAALARQVPEAPAERLVKVRITRLHPEAGRYQNAAKGRHALGLTLVLHNEIRPHSAEVSYLTLLLALSHRLKAREPEGPEVAFFVLEFLPGRVAENAVEAGSFPQENLGESDWEVHRLEVVTKYLCPL